MPLGPTGHEFFLEYNGSVFAQKLVDRIYSRPRNEWKNILEEKKNSSKYCSKIPLNPNC